METTNGFEADVVVVGGAGHVGLPLAIAFASRGLRVLIYDVNADSVSLIRSGTVPFREPGAAPLLRQALDAGTLSASTDPHSISRAEHVVVVVGTPVDEHLSPDADVVPRTVRQLLPHLRDGQLVVLRSTVYPGVTKRVERLLADGEAATSVAFCPERIAEGRAMEELFTLPQLVGARTQEVRQRASSLFGKLSTSTVEVEPEEAELAKLFTNAWRYIKFAAANQFFMMATDHGVDFEAVRAAVTHDYPRAADMPGPGFAAGPCLFKDTMQLAALSGNTFALGHAAMLVNEGLPQYLVSRMEDRFDLSGMRVGILGMAFKGESDDTRSSLSYKLRRLFEFRALDVLTTDPYVSGDPRLVPLSEVLETSDLLVVGAPHDAYRGLRTTAPLIDVWQITGSGERP